MQQFFIAIILVLGLSTYWLYTTNQTLAENNMKLEVALEEQKQAIEALRESYEKQGKALMNMSRKNAEIEAEKAEYLAIFSRHNLDMLALKKPGLITNRFNIGSEQVMETMENDTEELYNLTVPNDRISGCSAFGARKIETVSKPIEIDIMQPDLPRPLQLTAPEWWVVSDAVITNPCRKVFDEEKQKEIRPKACAKEDTENPDWPEGYTYLDRFLDEMKEQNNGEVLFVATTIGDYKVMAEDMQELRRYIKQMGEVIIYYRNVTIKGEPGVGAAVKKNETTKD